MNPEHKKQQQLLERQQQDKIRQERQEQLQKQALIEETEATVGKEPITQTPTGSPEESRIKLPAGTSTELPIEVSFYHFGHGEIAKHGHVACVLKQGERSHYFSVVYDNLLEKSDNTSVMKLDVDSLENKQAIEDKLKELTYEGCVVDKENRPFYFDGKKLHEIIITDKEVFMESIGELKLGDNNLHYLTQIQDGCFHKNFNAATNLQEVLKAIDTSQINIENDSRLKEKIDIEVNCCASPTVTKVTLPVIEGKSFDDVMSQISNATRDMRKEDYKGYTNNCADYVDKILGTVCVGYRPTKNYPIILTPDFIFSKVHKAFPGSKEEKIDNSEIILDQTKYVLDIVIWMTDAFSVLKNGKAIKALVSDLNVKSQELIGSINTYKEGGKKKVDADKIAEHFEKVKSIAKQIKKEVRSAHPIVYFLYGLIKLFSKHPVINAIDSCKDLEVTIKQNSECIKTMKEVVSPIKSGLR